MLLRGLPASSQAGCGTQESGERRLPRSRCRCLGWWCWSCLVCLLGPCRPLLPCPSGQVQGHGHTWEPQPQGREAKPSRRSAESISRRNAPSQILAPRSNFPQEILSSQRIQRRGSCPRPACAALPSAWLQPRRWGRYWEFVMKHVFQLLLYFFSSFFSPLLLFEVVDNGGGRHVGPMLCGGCVAPQGLLSPHHL